MKYAIFSDDFLSYFRLDDGGETLVLTDKQGCTRAVKLLPYVESPKSDQEAEWCDRSFMSSGNILRTRSDVVEYKCSNCHRWTQWWYGTNKNEYCSHCGSKMTNDSNTIKDYER